VSTARLEAGEAAQVVATLSSEHVSQCMEEYCRLQPQSCASDRHQTWEWHQILQKVRGLVEGSEERKAPQVETSESHTLDLRSNGAKFGL